MDTNSVRLVGAENKLLWNLCNPTPEFSDILCHPTYGPKVLLLTKLNLSFPTFCKIRHISLAPWCVGLERFHCIYFVCNFTLHHHHGKL